MAGEVDEVYEVVVRDRRQVTLPWQVCEALGLRVGDCLELSLEDDVFVARPKRAMALRALRAIQDAFAASGIGEEELLQAGQEIRERMYGERYAEKDTHLP